MTNKEKHICADCIHDDVCEWAVNSENMFICGSFIDKKVLERPQGEWIYDRTIPNWVCSECGAVPSDWGCTTNSKYTVTEINRFCRLCGADMRGDNND